MMIPVLEYCHTRTPACSLARGETRQSNSLEKKANILIVSKLGTLLTNLRGQGGVVGVGDHPGAGQAGVGQGPDARPAPPGHAAVVSPRAETDAETRDVLGCTIVLTTCFATGQCPP